MLFSGRLIARHYPRRGTVRLTLAKCCRGGRVGGACGIYGPGGNGICCRTCGECCGSVRPPGSERLRLLGAEEALPEQLTANASSIRFSVPPQSTQ
jgi:hypothetical protein